MGIEVSDKSSLIVTSDGFNKIKNYIKSVSVNRASDIEATVSDGADDLTNIVCYAVYVILNDPKFKDLHNSIFN
jgi:hypothetical protein